MIKKTTFNIKSMLLCMVFIMSALFSQAQERSCGMIEYMQEQMKNPEFAKQYEVSQAKFKEQLEKNLSANFLQKMGPIIIPVAVHFPEGKESDRACLEALAQNQIDILNRDYTGTNTDISKWTAASPYYPGVNIGAANILFCIATKNHPAGIDPDMIEGSPAVTIGYNFGNGRSTDAAWGGYMNFLVKNISGGILGFSPLGGSIARGDSVTMNLGAFGSGAGCPSSGIVPSAPYNLGRTVTHELGHFYNLDHIFGSCNTDDGIADTPNQGEPNYGCSTLGSQEACDPSEQELFQNYMDYSNDACMFMFTAGQTTVAEAYIMSIQSTFKQNVVKCSASPDFSLVAANPVQRICKPANTLNYSINYVVTGGNRDQTTFSATNLPDGATASFNPSSLNTDGKTVLTIRNLSSLAIGNYAITITGAGVTTNSISVDLNVDEALQTTPSLVSPSNGATDASLITSLNWNPVENATSYIIEMSTNATFTTNFIYNIVNSTGYNTPQLSPTEQYFWRVKSTNGCGESPYSPTRNFTTATIACGTYNSTENNINIPSSGNNKHVITSTIRITEDINITDLNATINISHDWAGDMDLMLTSPKGTNVVLLVNSTCDDGTKDIMVTYDDQASGPVSCSTTAPAVGGTIQPASPLSAFNGESTLGNWVLTAIDSYPKSSGGTFLKYSIEICGILIFSVEESNLDDSLSLWPNPSKGEINITFRTKNKDVVNFSLYDLRGRVINKQSFENTSGVFKKALQFRNLESSIYILRIENAGQIINRRIIIE